MQLNIFNIFQKNITIDKYKANLLIFIYNRTKILINNSMINLKYQDWDYMNEGDLHYILKYVGNQSQLIGKVLIIEKQDQKHEVLQLSTEKQKILKYFHNQLLQQFKQLTQFLLQKIKVDIDQQKKNQFLIRIQERIAQKKSKIRFKSPINLKSDIILSQNLFMHRSDIYLQSIFIQFKPKSPLYDQYSIDDLKLISQYLKIGVNEIVEVLNKCKNNIQKTKYFKKQLIRKENKNKITPVQSFNYRVQNYIQKSLISYIYGRSQRKKYIELISQNQFDAFLNMVIKKEKILEYIICLQTIYYKPSTLLNKYSKEQIINFIKMPENHTEILTKFIKQIEQKHRDYNINNLIQRQIVNNQILNQNVFQQLLRLLISTTWRDVSIIIQVNIDIKSNIKPTNGYKIESINQNYDANYKISIIDYDLKPISRIKSIPKNDLDHLKNYLLIKLKDSK